MGRIRWPTRSPPNRRGSISGVTPAAKRTLQQAAAVSNKTVSEFVFDSSPSAAFDMQSNRRMFHLDEVPWAAFTKALDAPPSDNPRLCRMLTTKAPWEP